MTTTDERKALAAEIRDLLAMHGKRSAAEPDEWNSPDAYQMEGAAMVLERGAIPRVPWSDWRQGGYAPLHNKDAQAWHDSILTRIAALRDAPVFDGQTGARLVKP